MINRDDDGKLRMDVQRLSEPAHLVRLAFFDKPGEF
jgi:hypothetical protein